MHRQSLPKDNRLVFLHQIQLHHLQNLEDLQPKNRTKTIVMTLEMIALKPKYDRLLAISVTWSRQVCFSTKALMKPSFENY